MIMLNVWVRMATKNSWIQVSKLWKTRALDKQVGKVTHSLGVDLLTL
jgi:hypothetical protein